jgi:hypothetical protein
MTPIRKFLNIRVCKVDLGQAKCGSRARCVVALATDRQEKLGGLGYIRVDANVVAYTQHGVRRRYHPPHALLRYLRKFDKIGQESGEKAARAAMPERSFKLTLIDTCPVSEPASRARMDQINALRNLKAAAARAKGISRKQPAKRYAGI